MTTTLEHLPLGLYEKALPYSDSWEHTLSTAKELGFSFLELSIDESAERQARLSWKKSKIQNIIDAKNTTQMRIPSICLSVHRAYPFGSADKKIRNKAIDIMKRAIDLADTLGTRVIQLAGYEIYYEKPHSKAHEYFIEGMIKSVNFAAQAQVMLGIEIMDTPYMNSVAKFLLLEQAVTSPWLKLYPDVGNLSAWTDYPEHEISLAIPYTVGIHLKDTYKVGSTKSKNGKGQFRDVPFGEGCVNFTSIFKSLKNAKYQGPFVVEMWARKDLSTAKKNITYAKKFLINKMRSV